MNGGFAVLNSSLFVPARLSSGLGCCCVALNAKPLVYPKKVNDAMQQQHIISPQNGLKCEKCEIEWGEAILARRM